MDSFAANFIKSHSLDATGTITATSTYSCPVCTKTLDRSTGDNIPDGIFIYDCPDHHGYFFPTGQLVAFKKAQQMKIEYHKLWHIPMPNVGSILLAGITLLLLSGGLAVTFTELQNKQNTQSQAQQILIDHAVYFTVDRTTLITATTGIDAPVTVHIPAFNNFVARMKTVDNRTHQLTIQNLDAGIYPYFFTIEVSKKEIQSETFTFTIQP